VWQPSQFLDLNRTDIVSVRKLKRNKMKIEYKEKSDVMVLTLRKSKVNPVSDTHCQIIFDVEPDMRELADTYNHVTMLKMVDSETDQAKEGGLF
tara:strand:+ start:2750 stop:3031 length:282 start_codon:yes stop_codon:yes gene_type:complete